MNKSLSRMFTRFAILASLFLLPLFAAAQCQGTFTYTINGNTVTFDGIVSPAPAPTAQYYWWFSDNNQSSTLQDPVHTFSSAGTYVVCFSVYDASTSCMDSVCQQVVVAGGCNADFVAYDSLNNVSFISTTTAGPGAQYIWDFGDGNYGTGANPFHSYAVAGTYTVCLMVYDSMQNFCDSTCHSVTVQGQGGCVADFTSIDSLGYVFFISSTTATGAQYVWDFGDGNYSNAANPSHVYMSPGSYLVCLTVYDSLQNFCDSSCHVVQVSTVGMDESMLQSSLNAAPNPADGSITLSFLATDGGNATVTFFDAAGRIATEQNFNTSTGHNRTEINTSNLPQGMYLVRIAVNGTVANKRVAITHQ